MVEISEGIDAAWGRLGAELRAYNGPAYEALTAELERVVIAHRKAHNMREHGTLLQRLLLLPVVGKAA